jgi:hypothetical protein
MVATSFLVPHVGADDLSAAFSLRHASARTGMLPARALMTDIPHPKLFLQESD